jgi:hypothetical protein
MEEELAHKYAQITQSTLVSSASFNRELSLFAGIPAIDLKLSCKDIKNKAKRAWNCTLVAQAKAENPDLIEFLQSSALTSVSSDESFRKVSCCGQYRVSVFKAEDKDCKGQVISVWKGTEMLATASTDKLCGKLCMNGAPFSGFCFDLSKSRVLFVADSKQKKDTSFWDEENSPDSGDVKPKGFGYDIKEHFGERLYEFLAPRVFSFDFFKGIIEQVSFDLPLSCCALGQLTLSPNGRLLAFVGWPDSNRRLGSVYYNSRKSVLFLHDLKTLKTWRVASDCHSPQYPRFCPDGKQLYFVTTKETWCHNHSFKLMRLILEDEALEVCIDHVKSPTGDFTGLWSPLLENPFLTEKLMILNTSFRSITGAILFSCTDKAFFRMSLPPGYEPNCSLTVQEVHLESRHLIAFVESLSMPSHVEL